MLKSTFALVNRLFPLEEASAHCDVPCGIYDRTTRRSPR